MVVHRHAYFQTMWPLTGEFSAQMASNVENVSIWWHHHAYPVNINSTDTLIRYRLC